MGAWGPAIFSDDTTSDIRGDYRELLEDQVPDDEATRRVIDAYRHLDADEEHVLWLALAAAQTLGSLDDQVKTKALEVIDNDLGLELWIEAGPKELARRRAALAKLRVQLTGPKPNRKVLRRPWRHETDLRPGDVLSFVRGDGTLALLRVTRIDDQRVGAAPIAELLDWNGRSLPPAWRLNRLNPCCAPRPSADRRARYIANRTASQEGPRLEQRGFHAGEPGASAAKGSGLTGIPLRRLEGARHDPQPRRRRLARSA